MVTPEGTTTYGYNPNKQLTDITSPNSVSRTYGYDAKGRVNSVGETIAGSSFTTNFTFDSFGRLSTRTHPSGIVETLGYNSYGYLETVSAGGSTRYTLTSMNAREQLTGATYGSDLLATYGFDAYGYPNLTSAGPVQDYRYVFDPVTGNLSSRQNYSRGLSESFSYTDNGDNLDRLTEVSGPQNLNMTYDATGNIKTKSDISSTVNFGYGTDAGPYALTEVTSSTGVIPTDSQTATYTSFEKVGTIAEGNYNAAFVYNSDNQRAKMDVTQSGSSILTRWYAGSSYMKETAGGETREYTYLGGDAYSAPVVAVTQNGTSTYYYLLRDYLGNITHQVNTSNAVVAEYNFDAWGRRRSADDWSYTLDGNDLALFADRGFTGHEHLQWFNLYNMNGRLYDPLIGRFLNVDPYVQMPDYTQNFNRYSYCLNNPLKYTDPSGDLFWIIPNISFSPNGGLNFSLTFGVGVPGAFGGQLTVGGGAGGFNVTAGGFLGSANAYAGYSSSGGFIAGAGLGLGGLSNGFNTNMTGVGVNYSSNGGLGFNMSATQFDTHGNMNIDPSIGYSRMIYTSKESSISEISAAGMGVVPKEIAKVGTDAQKDTFLKRMGVKLSSFGVESVQMENKVFPKEMNGYKRWEDGIITNKKVEPVGGVTYSKGGWFPHSTIFMSPHNTERNFAISLNHEFIHAWQWQQFGNRMSKSEWEAYMEPSAYSYTNMYYSGFDKQVLYNGILNLYNWPTNLIKVP